MKKLEGEPSPGAERVAIGSIALKKHPTDDEKFAKAALARDWAEFLAREDEDGQAGRLSAVKHHASKATKLDPTYAFGFYVLGRVATIEGLEGHGVRFFQRALELDPGLAEKEPYLRVVVNSNRAAADDEPPTTPDLSSLAGEEPETAPNPMMRPMSTAAAAKSITAPLEHTLTPAPEGTIGVTEIAPEFVEAVEHVRSKPAPEEAVEVPKAGKSGARIAALILVLAGLAIGVVLWLSGALSGTSAPVAARSSASPSPSPTSPTSGTGVDAMPASAASSASASPPAVSAQRDASEAPDGSAAPAATLIPIPGPTQGLLKSRGPAGHRIFVDGVVVGETPGQVLVTCGSHVVKLGSAGREQTIDFPCADSVVVEP
jgi:hypothetical protein